MDAAARTRLETALAHRFNDASLLAEALTHPSRTGAKGGGRSYDRLEFLGDRVLGLAIAEMLQRLYPDASAGDLSRRSAALVRQETLAEVARALDVGAALDVAAADRAAGTAARPAVLADAMEAVLAALYLDGGLAAVRAVVERHWQARAQTSAEPPADAKTVLQEWAQGAGKPVPTYRVIAQEGPAHRPQFTVEVHVDGLPPATATGASKREAEQAAAAQMLVTRASPNVGNR
jgi:ribonuclease-3